VIIAVIISERSASNDELIAVAGRLAESRRHNLMLVGVAQVPSWVKTMAPFAAGSICVSQLCADTRAEVEAELRRCIPLVPVTVAARHACCGGWSDSTLGQLLRLDDRPTVVTAFSARMCRGRRRLEAIVKQAAGEIVIVPAPPAPSVRQAALASSIQPSASRETLAALAPH
jgi:hypothetical protein